jgi:hypothetical protein
MMRKRDRLEMRTKETLEGNLMRRGMKCDDGVHFDSRSPDFKTMADEREGRRKGVENSQRRSVLCTQQVGAKRENSDRRGRGRPSPNHCKFAAFPSFMESSHGSCIPRYFTGAYIGLGTFGDLVPLVVSDAVDAELCEAAPS